MSLISSLDKLVKDSWSSRVDVTESAGVRIRRADAGGGAGLKRDGQANGIITGGMRMMFFP